MSKNNCILLPLMIVTAFFASIAGADVRLPSIIDSNMVLQQNTKVPIWGWAQPNENIQIETSWGYLTSTTADKAGNWKVKIQTEKAGGPHQITIKANNTITLNNVLTGEVWLCSGQSNMEVPITYVAVFYTGVINAEAEVAQANYPQIRLFDVKNDYSIEPKKDCTGTWKECNSQTAATFSAAGYFFGRKLYKELNVPIGLITCDWGGTPAQSWTSTETLEKVPGFEESVKLLKDKDKAKQIIAQFQEKLAGWQQLIKKTDPGFTGKWQNPDTNDNNWKTMNLPVNWEHAGLSDFDGSVWFRKTITLSSDWLGKELTLKLGAIDDYDTTYFNGTKIGETDNWYENRKYNVPNGLAIEGKNVITVRAYDTQGLGGLTGPAKYMKLYKYDDQSIAVDGKWKYKIGLDNKNIPKKPQPPLINHYQAPATLYNAMLNPIIPYGIAGAIWYQGESNADNPKQYKILFPAMIKCWRDAWGQGDFPFYYVQIAPYRYYKINSAFLREAQFMTLSVPNTGMIVTTDITNLDNIHPENKQDVGKRLALWALAKTYNKEEIVCSGPLYKSMKIQDDKIRLFFDYLGGGLIAKDGDLTHFTIAGEDKKFHPAKAVIDGDTVVVSSDDVKKPVAVRFGFDNTATPNFFNKAQLPASTFRTDNW